MHERARDHSVDAIKTGETAKPGVPDDAAPKRRARMPQEASSRARPYPSNPPKPAPHRPGFGRGRSLPLATQHAGKIGSRFQSVERKVTQHFIASMSVRLHRIRCSACSGFGVHDGWNTHQVHLLDGCAPTFAESNVKDAAGKIEVRIRIEVRKARYDGLHGGMVVLRQPIRGVRGIGRAETANDAARPRLVDDPVHDLTEVLGLIGRAMIGPGAE